MTDKERGSADLRNVFGSNLRRLARSYPSVSALCRQLGINRTQFNRYLSGESYPRPDVLDQICRFFGVDARILLKPLDKIDLDASTAVFDAFDHIARVGDHVELPNGFYHVEPTSPKPPFTHLIFVRRVGPCVLLRCYAPSASEIPQPKFTHEIRGFATHSGQMVYAILARLGGHDHQILLVSDADSTGTLWSGHVVDLSSLSSPQQNTRPVELRFIGDNWRDALPAVRVARSQLAVGTKQDKKRSAESV